MRTTFSPDGSLTIQVEQPSEALMVGSILRLPPRACSTAEAIADYARARLDSLDLPKAVKSDIRRLGLVPEPAFTLGDAGRGHLYGLRRPSRRALRLAAFMGVTRGLTEPNPDGFWAVVFGGDPSDQQLVKRMMSVAVNRLSFRPHPETTDWLI